MKPCIELFGTCSRSIWRNEFINKYNTLGINFFNPQKDNWTVEDTNVEAEHLANDSIILFQFYPMLMALDHYRKLVLV